MHLVDRFHGLSKQKGHQFKNCKRIIYRKSSLEGFYFIFFWGPIPDFIIFMSF